MVGGAAPKAAQAATVVSASHPNAFYYGFNSGAVPFEAFAVPGGVASGARFTPENGTLKITNAFAGSFSVDTKIKPFDADKYQHIFFDYKLTPDVKVNLFFRVSGQSYFHGVTFSGPDRVRPGSVLMGKIAGVKADNQWHRAHIPLRDWLRESDPLATDLNIDMVVFGNWDNEGWLMAGIGGNGPGATWWIDNFAIVGSGPGEAKFELRDDEGKALPNPPAANWTLDGKKAGQGASASTSASDGYHLAEARDAGGKLIAAYPIFAAPGAPKIAAARLDGDFVRIPINAPGGLMLSDLKLTLNGQDYGIKSKFLQWDGEELSFDAGAAGMQWKDGAPISLALSGVQDEQKRAAAAWQSNLAVSYAAHKEAPNVPHVLIEGVPAPPPRAKLRTAEALQLTVPAPIFGAGDGTFEEGKDEWMTTSDGDAQLDRDDSTAASGKYSLRLTCPANAARFWATIRTSGFDAAKIPVISFDYKVPPQLRVDFMLLFDGKTYSVQFTDKDNPALRIGSVPDVIADNKWHHTEFNLGNMLREIAPTDAAGKPRSEYRVDSLYIGDGGWLGNASGVQYWFDNFQFVPLVKATPLQATVAVDDVTGIKGLSWVLDDNPKTPVPSQAKATTNKIELSGAGRKWLHIRAQNGAGEWSPALDMPLWLSEGAPKVALNEITPPDGAHIVPAALEIPLRAEGGIKADSIKLTVAGHEFGVGDAALTYNKKSNKIVWDAAQALTNGTIKVPKNGARVGWTLAPVSDFLGESAQAAQGHWINDFAADKIGPAVNLKSETHDLYFFDDAEGDLQWQAGEGSKAEKIERENGGQPSGHAARFTTVAAGTSFSVSADFPQAQAWDVRKYSLISFDYKVPPEANVALRLKFSNGRAWPLNFAGEKQERTIGTIPDVVADNKWHTATFNLGDFLERDRSSRNATVTSFEFLDSVMKTPANVSWELDNFLIQQAGGKEAKLSWSAQDLSGIKAYRAAWDQKPNTMPSEVASETSRAVTAEPGLYYMHLQAQDGAENWGPVAHIPVVLSEKASSRVSNPFSGGLILR